MMQILGVVLRNLWANIEPSIVNVAACQSSQSVLKIDFAKEREILLIHDIRELPDDSSNETYCDRCPHSAYFSNSSESKML